MGGHLRPGADGTILTLQTVYPLKNLDLCRTNIGDEGVASLVAQPTAGALKTLESLYLERNEISDAGCASLASALRGGALPALKRLNLDENPPSKEARDAVFAARPGVESRYHLWFLG